MMRDYLLPLTIAACYGALLALCLWGIIQYNKTQPQCNTSLNERTDPVETLQLQKQNYDARNSAHGGGDGE